MDPDKTGVVTELRARGYAVLPTPRQVELEDGSARLDAEWKLALEKVDGDDVAVRTLRSALASEIGLELGAGKAGGGKTILRIGRASRWRCLSPVTSTSSTPRSVKPLPDCSHAAVCRSSIRKGRPAAASRRSTPAIGSKRGR